MLNLNTKIFSDNHFGHDNILKYESKRKIQMKIDGYNNMNEWLLNNWNSQVNKNDKVLNMGDIAFRNINEYLPKLNGQIDLILGNHDRKGKQTYSMLNNVYDHIYYEKYNLNLTIKNDPFFSGIIKEISGLKILFSHYPVFHNCPYDSKKEKVLKRIKCLEEIYTSFDCDFNIHGHTHSTPSNFKNSFNVSLDATNFKIYTLKEILEKII